MAKSSMVIFISVFALLFSLKLDLWIGVPLGALFGMALALFRSIAPSSLMHRSIALTIGLTLGLAQAALLSSFFPTIDPKLLSAQVALISLSLIAAFSALDLLEGQVKKVPQTSDLFVDATALKDPRIIDLSASGLVDGALVIPQFVLEQIKIDTDSKEALSHLKKLEELPSLKLRYHKKDFSKELQPTKKMAQLVRAEKGRWLTSHSSRIESSESLNIRLIDIDSLANRLKPLRDEGETLEIKIQRPGKEEGQGVGYLEDGTMVVVNGGGDYIGCTIEADVLSTKHTMAGRIIFCNAGEKSRHLEMSS